MILLLGASSYIGRGFARELQARGQGFIPLSRKTLDYTRFELLFEYIRSMKPEFVINAAGIASGWEVEDAEHGRTEIFEANTLLPQTVGRVCEMTNTPWGHVSSACIYKGAKVFRDMEWKTERDLNCNGVRRWFALHPENFLGFHESDEPNHSFRHPPCSYVAGTKALAEEWLRERERTYVWRAGLPVDEVDGPGSLLWQLQNGFGVEDQIVSVSHVGDFARACLSLIEGNAAYGIYNVANLGVVTTGEIIRMQSANCRVHNGEPWKDRMRNEWRPQGRNTRAEQTQRSRGNAGVRNTGFGRGNGVGDEEGLVPSCILDSGKIARAGVTMRTARDAVRSVLESPQATKRIARVV